MSQWLDWRTGYCWNTEGHTHTPGQETITLFTQNFRCNVWWSKMIISFVWQSLSKCILYGKIKIKTCLASWFFEKKEGRGTFFLRKCSEYPYLTFDFGYSALWMISENKEEALFILLFWKVSPSYDHKTLKCVLKASTAQTSLRRS